MMMVMMMVMVMMMMMMVMVMMMMIDDDVYCFYFCFKQRFQKKLFLRYSGILTNLSTLSTGWPQKTNRRNENSEK